MTTVNSVSRVPETGHLVVRPNRAKRNDDGRAVDLLLQLCGAIDTPLSLSCYLLAKNGEWQQYLDKKADVSQYLDPLSYFKDAQCLALLSKYPSLPGYAVDRKAVAYKKFLEAEDQCALTNERFRLYWDQGLIHPDVGAVLHTAQRKISRILGDVPSLESLDFRFGPGASFGVRGDTSAYNKLSSQLEATAPMLQILPEFLTEFPGWLDPGTVDVSIVRGSELTFVPKNAKVDRPICIEPMLNGLYQKGIGSYMRTRLRFHGCDLRDQTRNQKLAQVAHIRGLATIDLSSASDTIAYNLIQDLLPCEWFDFLEVARCPSYRLEDHWFTFQKFSSMGNAYTFELESLVFLALALSTCEHLGVDTTDSVSVYGDDIIIPRAAVPLFKSVLSFCGFSMNSDKSFTSGQFFESCGRDFLQGCDVRPFYLKTRLNGIRDLYYAANTVSRIASKLFDLNPLKNGYVGRCKSMRDPYFRLVDSIPRGLRHLGPEGYGDGHLISDFDHARPSRARRGWDGWRYRTTVERPILAKLREWPKAYALYFAGYEAEASSGYARRGRTRIAEVTSVAPVWCHLGRWS